MTLAAALVLAWAASAAAEKPAPVAVYLEPIDQGAVQGFTAEKVGTALRERLRKLKDIRLVPEAEEARVVLRVSECLGWSETKRVEEPGGRDMGIPTRSGGVARGGEGSWGYKTEQHRQVSLVVRATWAEHFADLQSATDERQLKGAIDTVASQLAAIVRRGLKPR